MFGPNTNFALKTPSILKTGVIFRCVATAKINRVATNIFILKRKGMPANHKTKQQSHCQRKRVRESITRGEGISTPRAHRTRWYPRLCLKLWVCKQTALTWTKMHAKCREK